MNWDWKQIVTNADGTLDLHKIDTIQKWLSDNISGPTKSAFTYPVSATTMKHFLVPITSNIRWMYDMLDSMGIYVIPHMNTDFTWSSNFSKFKSQTRIDAEILAFKSAIANI